MSIFATAPPHGEEPVQVSGKHVSWTPPQEGARDDWEQTLEKTWDALERLFLSWPGILETSRKNRATGMQLDSLGRMERCGSWGTPAVCCNPKNQKKHQLMVPTHQNLKNQTFFSFICPHVFTTEVLKVSFLHCIKCRICWRKDGHWTRKVHHWCQIGFLQRHRI